MRCAGEGSVFSYLTQQRCLTQFIPLRSSLGFSGHGTFLLFVLPHSFPMTSVSWSLFPGVGSILGTLRFSIFHPYSLPWLAHPVSCRWLPKFISSSEPTPELQTHIFNCLLTTPLGCLITTSRTALPGLLLPQTYPSQLMPTPSFQFLRQKPQTRLWLLSSTSFVYLISEQHIEISSPYYHWLPGSSHHHFSPGLLQQLHILLFPLPLNRLSQKSSWSNVYP